MSGSGDAIRAASRAHGPELVRIRRAVHGFPELGFKETRTAALIRSTLKKYGVEHKPLCGTGTVAIVRGRRDGPTVLMRADIDGLPIAELNAVPYASKNRGVMHA